MKRIYPTEDGGEIHEYAQHRSKKNPADSAGDETIITVKLANNIDFVRIESICISRKESE